MLKGSSHQPWWVCQATWPDPADDGTSAAATAMLTWVVMMARLWARHRIGMVQHRKEQSTPRWELECLDLNIWASLNFRRWGGVLGRNVKVGHLMALAYLRFVGVERSLT